MQHISTLRSECANAMYILQALSSTQWGGDPAILSMIYKSFVCSKMDYGTFLYGAATYTQLRKLDVIQNQTLRHILGAIKTTPIVALEAETKIPPLQIRRTYLAQKHLCLVYLLDLIRSSSLKFKIFRKFPF